jgi:hypothetical protein
MRRNCGGLNAAFAAGHAFAETDHQDPHVLVAVGQSRPNYHASWGATINASADAHGDDQIIGETALESTQHAKRAVLIDAVGVGGVVARLGMPGTPVPPIRSGGTKKVRQGSRRAVCA